MAMEMIDGRKVSIPSFQIREGQSITIKEGSKKNDFIRTAVESARGRGILHRGRMERAGLRRIETRL